MTWDTLHIHKRQPTKKILAFIRFHCFDISKHFSTTFHNFCLMFCGFCWILKIAWRCGVLAQVFAPGMGILHFRRAQGMGILPIQKIPREFAGGNGQTWN